MKKLFLSIFLISLLSLQGCVTANVSKQQAFPKMYEETPLSVAVLPPINNSTAADAPDLYLSTISEPISNAGYYVMPIPITTAMLQAEGIDSGSQLINVPTEKFRTLFGADAVLFVTIDQWDTNYYLVGGNVTVGLNFKMKSTLTGEVIWQYKDVIVQDTSGDSGGGGLLGAMIAAAITTAMQDYVPVARNVNLSALRSLPVGKYHPLHSKDQEHKVVSVAKSQ